LREFYQNFTSNFINFYLGLLVATTHRNPFPCKGLMTFPVVSTVFTGFLGTPKQHRSFFSLLDVLSSSIAPLKTSTQSGSSLSDTPL